MFQPNTHRNIGQFACLLAAAICAAIGLGVGDIDRLPASGCFAMSAVCGLAVFAAGRRPGLTFGRVLAAVCCGRHA